jgi:hypothetical protein
MTYRLQVDGVVHLFNVNAIERIDYHRGSPGVLCEMGGMGLPSLTIHTRYGDPIEYQAQDATKVLRRLLRLMRPLRQ